MPWLLCMEVEVRRKKLTFHWFKRASPFFFFMSGVFFCYIYSVKKHVDSVIFCNKRKNNCEK